MAETKSLLSLIARGYAAGREDAATEALCYILSRSDSARTALSELLGYSGDSLPIATFRTQYFTSGAYPDMVCFDNEDRCVAFVESKFWASLTRNQPVTYWKALPGDRSATLLFLAPAARTASIDKDSLWDELVKRLHNAGHALGPVNQGKGLVTAKASDGRHRLLLTSWEVLLDRLAQRTKKDGDDQAHFEVDQLRGLASDAIEGEEPLDTQLRQLIVEAVARMKELVWANTDRLTSSNIEGVRYARYFRLAGASAGLRIDYKAAKEMGKPLWLWFWSGNDPGRLVKYGRCSCQVGRIGRSRFGMASQGCLCTHRLDGECWTRGNVRRHSRRARTYRHDHRSLCSDLSS